MTNNPPHMFGSLIDHAYIKKTLTEEFFSNAFFKNIYFSDHDAVRIPIEKILLLFILVHKI